MCNIWIQKFHRWVEFFSESMRHKFFHADDFCCGTPAHAFVKLECTLSSDVARMTDYCHQWYLKPNAANTATFAFHLHNTSVHRNLGITLDGKCLRHNPPTDEARWFFMECMCKNVAIIGTGSLLFGWWVLPTSLGSFCTHEVKLVDMQIISTLRLLTSALQPMPVSWLSVLSSIEPAALRHVAAVDKLISKAIGNSKWGSL